MICGGAVWTSPLGTAGFSPINAAGAPAMVGMVSPGASYRPSGSWNSLLSNSITQPLWNCSTWVNFYDMLGHPCRAGQVVVRKLTQLLSSRCHSVASRTATPCAVLFSPAAVVAVGSVDDRLDVEVIHDGRLLADPVAMVLQPTGSAASGSSIWHVDRGAAPAAHLAQQGSLHGVAHGGQHRVGADSGLLCRSPTRGQLLVGGPSRPRYRLTMGGRAARDLGQLLAEEVHRHGVIPRNTTHGPVCACRSPTPCTWLLPQPLVVVVPADCFPHSPCYTTSSQLPPFGVSNNGGDWDDHAHDPGRCECGTSHGADHHRSSASVQNRTPGETTAAGESPEPPPLLSFILNRRLTPD